MLLLKLEKMMVALPHVLQQIRAHRSTKRMHSLVGDLCVFENGPQILHGFNMLLYSGSQGLAYRQMSLWCSPRLALVALRRETRAS